MDLYKIVKNTYAKKKDQKNAFKDKGYVYDEKLSNKNNAIYYNPETKQLIHSVKGTNPLSVKDLYTDAMLSMGMLKKTDRYKDSHKKLRQAKEKYGVDSADIVGHSLGGSISSYIGSKNDKVYTLNKGATIGQKSRNNEKAYRTEGDMVSILNKNSKNMTTLKNPDPQIDYGGILGRGYTALQAHNVDNIKNSGILFQSDIPLSNRDQQNFV
jgi:Tfp pilus assembly protein PilP